MLRRNKAFSAEVRAAAAYASQSLQAYILHAVQEYMAHEQRLTPRTDDSAAMGITGSEAAQGPSDSPESRESQD